VNHENEPVPGDVSVCIECGIFLTFTSEVLALLSESDYESLDTETRFQLQRAKQAIQAIQRQNE